MRPCLFNSFFTAQNPSFLSFIFYFFSFVYSFLFFFFFSSYFFLYIMSQVPFTSHLEMWSPSPSVSNFSVITPTSIVVRDSYYHEPVFYPSDCMLCGLPHTRMQPNSTHLPAISTPAPFYKKRRTRNVQKKPKKFIYSVRLVIHKLIRICTVALKAPLTKRHVYPIKRAE